MAKKQKKGATNLLEVQNAAKTLFANVRFQSIDKPIKSILLTSTVPDEGKTTSMWYFAQAAATAGHNVLIVEGDMRRRTVASMLRIHPEHGIFSVLSGNTPLKNAIVPTSVRNLYFLDAEAGIPNPADLLASKRMRKLNEELCSVYDYVIYDTPPVGTFVDAAVLGSIVDASILVVRPGSAKRSDLEVAYEQMRNAGANVIGICSTFVEGTGSEYYYSYYTKDKRRAEEKKAVAETPQIPRGPRASNPSGISAPRQAPVSAQPGARHEARTGAGSSISNESRYTAVKWASNVPSVGSSDAQHASQQAAQPAAKPAQKSTE